MKTKAETKLPTLLEKRKREYDLPDCPYQPAFDRIAVFVVPEDMAKRETYAKGGLIVKPQAVTSIQQRESARGIIVAAGLGAMDVMRSHGIELGHIVWVARLSPWRHEIERTDKGAVEMLFMRVGDIVGSEDTLEDLGAGRLAITLENEQHRYTGTGDHRTDPPDYVA